MPTTRACTLHKTSKPKGLQEMPYFSTIILKC